MQESTLHSSSARVTSLKNINHSASQWWHDQAMIGKGFEKRLRKRKLVAIIISIAFGPPLKLIVYRAIRCQSSISSALIKKGMSNKRGLKVKICKRREQNGKLHCLRISPEISLLRAEGFQVPAWRGLRQKVGVFRSTSGLGGWGGWVGGVWEVLIDALVPCRALAFLGVALAWAK